MSQLELLNSTRIPSGLLSDGNQGGETYWYKAMTVTILNEKARAIRVQASVLDEGFDYTRDRSQIVLDNGHRCAYARVKRFDEVDGCEFEVEASLTPRQFTELKSIIASL
jgi:hypothetical protein